MSNSIKSPLSIEPTNAAQRANRTLIKYLPLFTKGRVLDLGAGYGANSFFFAQNGFSVEGIDFCPKAIQKLRSGSDCYEGNVRAHNADIRCFRYGSQQYSLIIASMILHYFRLSEIQEVTANIRTALDSGGFVYISAFSTEDPSFSSAQNRYRQIEERTFYNEELQSPIHYVTKDEVLDWFSEYKTISLSTTKCLDIGHGEPHYHGVIELLAQKPHSHQE